MQDKNPSASDPLILRLYVAGSGPHSVQAIANLKAILKRCVRPQDCQMETIDVLKEPLRALEDAVLVTPTLVRIGLEPLTIVGNLEDHDQVMQALGLEEAA
jgi:circadian clock protein KaiB